MRISHSAASKYQQCGEAYRLHYIEKYREKNTSAALLFGTAIDEALNYLCETRSIEIAKKAFIDHWKVGLINNQKVDLKDSPRIVYAAADFDEELLTSEDVDTLNKLSTPMPWLEKYKEVAALKKQIGKDRLSVEQQRFLSQANWHCLLRKGLLMIEAYEKKILPRIKKVIAVQKRIEVTNTTGDTIVGVIDMVCVWDDGSVIIFDHKTSAQPYDEDAVTTKPQLPLYVWKMEQELEKKAKAGYIVFIKNIQKNRIKLCSVCGYDGSEASHKTCPAEVKGKRCKGAWNEQIKPEAKIQLLIDSIPERMTDMVLENFDAVNHAIQAGIFPKNLSTCKNVYGGPCPFFELCHKGDDSKLERAR